MTEQEFKDHYVATFLATYRAVHYDEHRMNSHPTHQHIEDAIWLAKCAWEEKEALE